MTNKSCKYLQDVQVFCFFHIAIFNSMMICYSLHKCSFSSGFVIDLLVSTYNYVLIMIIINYNY